ncbi:MAG: LacI family DNA-binding transcriptional regulator [Sphaerochaetaceae bacterium]|nr:LacI family DNA-binding transcriptional regulator [Sphaerochaetaceae bacterium]
MQSTISDIAKEANVSTATVSRVLNGNSNVTEETKARVLAAINKYNYTPSIIARGLKNKSMKTIAVVIKLMTHTHYARIANVIDQHFSNKGFDVVIYETASEGDTLDLFLRRMVDKSVDGIAFIGSAFEVLTKECPNYEEILKGIPIVIANGWVDGAYGIQVDEAQGTKDLVDHFVSMNRKHIAFIRDYESGSANNKLKGFKEGIEKHGLTKQSYIYRYSEDESGLRNDIKTLAPDIDAIICVDDLLALKINRLLQENGKKVPQDICLAGFNNSFYNTFITPTLTTVDNKPELQGEVCVDILEKALTGQCNFEKKIIRVISTDLIVRESSNLLH